MSSHTFISSIEPTLPGVGSTNNIGENKDPEARTPIETVASKYTISNESLVREVPFVARGQFEFEDGDIYILAKNTLLATHRYLLKRFSRLKDRVADRVLVLTPEDHDMDDFRNTFKILYTSVIEETFAFDPVTLTSALRLATTYDYPALRVFAIKHLENASLSAVERIKLAREFNVLSWEEPAYIELCERDEAITMLEAAVLGLDAFVHVARIREKEQRRRGRDIDAATEQEEFDEEDDGGEEEAAAAAELEEFDAGKGSSPVKSIQIGGKRTRSAASGVLDSNIIFGEVAQAKEAKTSPDEKGQVEPILKPCFVGMRTPSAYWYDSKPDKIEIAVPGCECKAWYAALGVPPPSKNGIVSCQCKVPPCVVSAFKQLQTQQIAFNDDISKLETTIEHIQMSLDSPTSASASIIEPDLDGALHTQTIQEDVHNWLISSQGGAAAE